jgi:serine/threonine protein kinase
MHPREFGKYRILKLLPPGGMGRVYLAENTATGARIALKLIEQAPGPEYEEIVEAERRGAHLQESLCRTDPRIANVLCYGELSGFFYIEMEYVEGQDLAEVLARGPLGVPFAARIGRDLCETLHQAHSFSAVIEGHAYHGVVHGDIKPRNIRITPDGQVRVLDFGIAKALSATRKFTENRFGSSQYSSPERLLTGDVDFSSDLWSVGVVLYEIVAGRPYFEAESGARLESAIRNYRAHRPLPETLPAPFAAILRKAVHPDRAERYQTAAEFATDLDSFLAGRPTLAETMPVALVTDNDDEKTRRTVRPPATAEDDDEALTRRTASPGPAVPAGYKAVTPRPKRPVTPLQRRIRLGVMAALLIGAIWFVGNEISVYRAASALREDVEAERLTDMNVAWERYHQLALRNHTPFLLWGTRRALLSRMIAFADRTILEYRNSDSPTVSEGDWVRAEAVLAKALDLDPGDEEIRGKRYLAAGHISRINGTARASRSSGKLLADARQKFEQARELMPKSPDPWLGLARLYVYALKDVEKAEDALRNASKRGHELGRREKAQLGDGYRDRAERLLQEADRATGLPEEKDYLERARADFRRAEEFYRDIVPFGGSANSLRKVLDFADHVDVRLRIIREGA